MGRKLKSIDTHFSMADILGIDRGQENRKWKRFCVMKPRHESNFWRMTLVGDTKTKAYRIRKSLINGVCAEQTGEELGGVCSGIFRPLKKQKRNGDLCLLGELLQ